MSETIVIPERTLSTEPETGRATELAGVLAMSFASLLLELALTRLFSVILFYHFAFLAISIALLGLGAGGVFAYIFKQRLSRWNTRTLGFALGIVNAVLLLLVLELDLHLRIFVRLTISNFLRLTVLYLASALPFFVTGLFFSILFARRSGRIAQLYAVDLAGGALACVGIVPLLNLVGGPNVVLAAAVASALAAAIWASTRNWRRFALLVAAALVVLTAANYSGKLIDIIWAKGYRRDQPWVLFARWNALSRVEVDDQRGAKVIVIDADASTYIMNTDPKNWGPGWRKNLMSAAPSIANIIRPRGTYAIIGPGGGVDVLRAIANGSPSVTGIDINPIIVNDIMRGRWADWSYHLYDRPDVHIHISDGRSWIRNSHEHYDVLQMTLVDTWASTAAGALALSENNLYTVEAFHEYFDHLKPDGLIAITRWEFQKPREALRVASNAVQALHDLGIGNDEIADHFLVVSDGPLRSDGRPVTVLAKKSPFTRDEQVAVWSHMTGLADLRPVAPGERAPTDLHPVFIPQLKNNPDLTNTAFYDLLERYRDPWQFAAHYRFNVTPVYDNAPFFFFTIKLNDVMHGILTGTGEGMDWYSNLGLVVLAMVLVISAVAVVAFLILPLALAPAHAGARVPHGIRILYFVAIGLGYILAEIAFIQRFVLFLGHPTYALTVVIFLMLLSSGAGSALSRRWLSDPLRVWIPVIAVIVLLTAYVWALPPLLRWLIGLAFAVKLVISAAVLVPLGLAMGMPFPSGLRALAGSGGTTDNAVEWAWAMNAASSVLGSVLAMVIAIQFGLGITLACGAAAYVLALALIPRLRPA